MTRDRLEAMAASFLANELDNDWLGTPKMYERLTSLLERVAEVSKRECYGYSDGLIHGMVEQREADAKIAEDCEGDVLGLEVAKAIREAK